jgi:hypothetical protein
MARDGRIYAVMFGNHEMAAREILSPIVVREYHSYVEDLMAAGWAHVSAGRIDQPYIALSEAQLDTIESAMYAALAIVDDESRASDIVRRYAYADVRSQALRFADCAASILREYRRA